MASSNRMIARHAPRDGADDFPTPPWATRALTYYVLTSGEVQGKTAWDPAAGRGHMADALRYAFEQVEGSDIVDYGVGFDVRDFTKGAGKPVDWVITNPPYKLTEAFFFAARDKARVGIAFLVRLGWLQNPGRYERIFRPYPPAVIAQLAGRMPAAQGKVIRGPSGYFQHCWVMWRMDHGPSAGTRFQWIPPEAQQKLERKEDYE